MLFSSQHQYFLDKWQLSTPNKRLETFSSYLYWCQRSGQAVVLKIYKDHSDEAASSTLLRHYNGNGAVQVLAHTDAACLLNVVGDGRELVELTRSNKDAEATQIFCDVVKNLHAAPKTNIGLKPIEEFIADFDTYLADDSIANRTLVETARQMFATLLASQGQRLNLHGDLHHYNILQTSDGQWQAIDPKGYWGEAEYEIGRYLINPLGDDYMNVDLKQRLEIIENSLAFDMERVKKWTFSQMVLAVLASGKQAVFDRHVLNVIDEFEELMELG